MLLSLNAPLSLILSVVPFPIVLGIPPPIITFWFAVFSTSVQFFAEPVMIVLSPPVLSPALFFPVFALAFTLFSKFAALFCVATLLLLDVKFALLSENAPLPPSSINAPLSQLHAPEVLMKLLFAVLEILRALDAFPVITWVLPPVLKFASFPPVFELALTLLVIVAALFCVAVDVLFFVTLTVLLDSAPLPKTPTAVLALAMVGSNAFTMIAP